MGDEMAKWRGIREKGSVVCSEKMHVDPVFFLVCRPLFGLETSGSGDWV
jgi:hypothetical protein